MGQRGLCTLSAGMETGTGATESSTEVSQKKQKTELFNSILFYIQKFNLRHKIKLNVKGKIIKLLEETENSSVNL